jgi:hypothetical protein
MKKVKILLFTLTIIAVAFVLSGCIPGNSNFTYNVVRMPANWSYVNSMAIGNNIVLLAGTLNNASGAIGEYNISTGFFQDLSSQIQSLSFQNVRSVTFVNNLFYIAGSGSNGAIFASFNPLNNAFTTLNQYIPFTAGNFSTFNSISTNGTSVLIGGSGSKTPLLLYNPSSPYNFNSLSVPYNFVVNSTVWDGNEYFVDGYNSNYYPANGVVGYLSPSGSFQDLSDYLPLYTGTLGAAGFNGQNFLIWSKNNSKATWSNGFYQMLSFNPSTSNFNAVSSTSFATNLSIPNNGITGANGWFVIGGNLYNQPYLVKYNLTENPIDLSSYLPYNTVNVSSVMANGSDLYLTGTYQNGNTFFEIVKGQL